MDTNETATALLRYFYAGKENGDEMPSFLRFARRHGTDIAALRQMKDNDAALAAAWQECEEILAERIAYGALQKRYDASFAKFLLSSRFGYCDKEKDAPEDFALHISVSDPE